MSIGSTDAFPTLCATAVQANVLNMFAAGKHAGTLLQLSFQWYVIKAQEFQQISEYKNHLINQLAQFQINLYQVFTSKLFTSWYCKFNFSLLKNNEKNLLMLQMVSFSNSVLTYFKHINTEAQQKVYHLPFDKNTATRTLTISLISLHKKVKKILTVLQTILLTLLNRFFFPPSML